MTFDQFREAVNTEIPAVEADYATLLPYYLTGWTPGEVIKLLKGTITTYRPSNRIL